MRINVETVLLDRSNPEAPGRYRVILGWSEADPIAVRIYFCEAEEEGIEAPIEWVVSRHLLSAGLAAPAGGGDVDVWPETGWIVLRLRGRDDHVITLHGDPRDFTRFLCGTYEAVSADNETIPGLDSELTAFLKGAASRARNVCPFCGARSSGFDVAALDHESGCFTWTVHTQQGES